MSKAQNKRSDSLFLLHCQAEFYYIENGLTDVHMYNESLITVDWARLFVQMTWQMLPVTSAV